MRNDGRQLRSRRTSCACSSRSPRVAWMRPLATLNKSLSTTGTPPPAQRWSSAAGHSARAPHRVVDARRVLSLPPALNLPAPLTMVGVLLHAQAHRPSLIAFDSHRATARARLAINCEARRIGTVPRNRCTACTCPSWSLSHPTAGRQSGGHL